jgi:acyl-CoA synthetase (NDP forming)
VAAAAGPPSEDEPKTLLACVFGPHPTTITTEGGTDVPVFDFPDDAAYALGRVTRYARWRREPEGTRVEPAGDAPDAARAVVADALAEGSEAALPTAVTVEVLAAAGLPMVPSRVVPDPDAAAEAAREVGYPVALKAVERTRLAKTESGGLALDVQDEADLRATLGRMVAALGERAWPVVVQPMAQPGVDVAVGVIHNPLVGPVISLGPGGAATPTSATQLHVLPLTDREARRFVAESRVADVLDAAGRAYIEDLVLRVGSVVDTVPEISALELNPVIVSPERVAIADAVVRAGPVDRNPLPPVRRL